MDCRTLLTVVVTVCSCSPAKEAEYFNTHRYSGRAPATSRQQRGRRDAHRSRPATALPGGHAIPAAPDSKATQEIQPIPACCNAAVLASEAEPLSITSVTVSCAIPLRVE